MEAGVSEQERLQNKLEWLDSRRRSWTASRKGLSAAGEDPEQRAGKDLKRAVEFRQRAGKIVERAAELQ